MELNREQQVIWAAGFVDGEGSIFLTKFRRKDKPVQYRLCLGVGQVDVRPLLRLKELWGGTIVFSASRGKGRADSYMWQLWGARAVTACTELLPYLMVKNAQAQLAVEYGPSRSSWSRASLSIGEVARREEFRALLSALNKTGVSKPSAAQSRVKRSASPQLRLLETS